MSEQTEKHETIWDAIEGALFIADGADIEPIAHCAKIQVQGAHGFSKPEGLIILGTDGVKYRVTAEILP